MNNSSPNKNHLKAAYQAKIDEFHGPNIYTLVDDPEGNRIKIPKTWKYKTKNKIISKL